MQTNNTTPYERPGLTPQDSAAVKALVERVINTRDLRKAYGLLGQVLLENMILTAEVNEHRAARGFDPLPTYQPQV